MGEGDFDDGIREFFFSVSISRADNLGIGREPLKFPGRTGCVTALGCVLGFRTGVGIGGGVHIEDG